MAKLSARGRTELFRLAKTSDDGSTVNKLALMSDRKLLTSTSYLEYGGKRRSGGWTVKGTLKAGVTPEQYLANRLAEGWQQVKR